MAKTGGGGGHSIPTDKITKKGNDKFSEEDVKLALKVQKKYGVPASVCLAQYAQESGYGKSTVGKNNYFNIKGKGTKGYKDYKSKEESFMDYGRLLSTEHYTSKTGKADTIQEYVQGIKDAGYAEDDNYVSSLIKIINSNDLTQLDTGIGAKGSVSNTKLESYGVEVGAGKAGLKWWGDIIRVIVILLLIVGAVVMFALSIGGKLESPVSKVMAQVGGKNGK